MKFFPKRRKIGIVASAGGHLAEAMKATSSIRECPLFYVTFSLPHLERTLAGKERYFIHFPRISLLGYLINFVQSCRIYFKEKPGIIITTGGGTAIPFCLIGKFFGSKIVFIESGSRVIRPSRASKILYPIADLSIVQWKSLLSLFPKAVYGGPLL
jgi:beta-1,4-N-acetylglucosaminyltransferase